MQKIKVVGIDLSKHIFQVHAVDARGNAIVRKQFTRQKLIAFLTNTPSCMVAMEACASAHHWGRVIGAMGHMVRLIPPQFVKPYVKTNKNDAADAEAITEAAMRPGMRFVPVKEEWQQDILAIHRIRERLVKMHTALMNEMRGLLGEYGIVIPAGATHLHQRVQKLMGEEVSSLSPAVQRITGELYTELIELERRLDEYEKRIRQISRSNETCRRLETIPGIGPVTSTALVASVGDPSFFKSGRQMAAWLGLVPKQNSSGGKTKLLGISKRGDRYLRKLLVHGSRTVLRHVEGKDDRRSRWLAKKLETRGFNKTCVALANKNARTCWALMRHHTSYVMTS
ncbi:MAG: IS110 family transposase [Anaerolineaceae bacterium]|nr:IS110 family transposase [Anaerolineaceae bacterium]